MHDDDLIAASSGLLLSFGLGALFGPYAASQVMKILGPARLFVHIAAVAASLGLFAVVQAVSRAPVAITDRDRFVRSEEHTSELQSLMRISYAVFCLKKKTQY